MSTQRALRPTSLSRPLSRPHSRPLSRSLWIAAVALVFATALAAEDGDERLLFQPATPDPARAARSAAWLVELTRQRPALELALRELARQRDHWRAERGTERCRRARRALALVDRGLLLAQQDYELVVAVGAAFDELDGAIRACSERRYFELDFRLDRASRSLAQARATARRLARAASGAAP